VVIDSLDAFRFLLAGDACDPRADHVLLLLRRRRPESSRSLSELLLSRLLPLLPLLQLNRICAAAWRVEARRLARARQNLINQTGRGSRRAAWSCRTWRQALLDGDTARHHGRKSGVDLTRCCARRTRRESAWRQAAQGHHTGHRRNASGRARGPGARRCVST